MSSCWCFIASLGGESSVVFMEQTNQRGEEQRKDKDNPAPEERGRGGIKEDSIADCKTRGGLGSGGVFYWSWRGRRGKKLGFRVFGEEIYTQPVTRYSPTLRLHV